MAARFSTGRLRCEQMRASHLDDLRRMHTSEPMMAMIGGTRDEAASVAYLDRHMAHWAEHGFGFWMLYDSATGTSAGLAGLRRLVLDGVDEVEVGYGFLPEFWGRGLGTEVARACVVAGFDDLELASLVALTKRANAASQHVLNKAGMWLDRELVHEGTPTMVFRSNRPAALT